MISLSEEIGCKSTPMPMDMLNAMASDERPRPFEFLFPLYLAGDWLKTERGPRRLLFDVCASNYFSEPVMTEGPKGESSDLFLWKSYVTSPKKITDLRYEMIPVPPGAPPLSANAAKYQCLECTGIASRDKESAPAEVRAHYGKKVIASVPKTRLNQEDHCEAFGLKISQAHLLEDGHTVILWEARGTHGVRYHVREIDHPPFNEDNQHLSMALAEKRRSLYGEVKTEGLPTVPHLDAERLPKQCRGKGGPANERGH